MRRCKAASFSAGESGRRASSCSRFMADASRAGFALLIKSLAPARIISATFSSPTDSEKSIKGTRGAFSRAIRRASLPLNCGRAYSEMMASHDFVSKACDISSADSTRSQTAGTLPRESSLAASSASSAERVTIKRRSGVPINKNFLSEIFLCRKVTVVNYFNFLALTS